MDRTNAQWVYANFPVFHFYLWARLASSPTPSGIELPSIQELILGFRPTDRNITRAYRLLDEATLEEVRENTFVFTFRDGSRLVEEQFASRCEPPVIMLSLLVTGWPKREEDAGDYAAGSSSNTLATQLTDACLIASVPKIDSVDKITVKLGDGKILPQSFCLSVAVSCLNPQLTDEMRDRLKDRIVAAVKRNLMAPEDGWKVTVTFE